jgi:hypothetical protein
MRALALVALLGLAVPAWAQDPASAQDPPPVPQIDATRLGVDLTRIEKGLRVAETKDQEVKDGLRLEFNIQVFGTAPRMEFLKDVDLFNGHVPGTAPTHRQMIEYWTPAIYRQPVMPVSALAFWAAKHLWQQSRKAKCEEEIRAYRELVMQGVNVAAPRCTQ